MSHFYGKLQGCRGEATRCGSKDSGIHTTAASWEGAITVSLNRDEELKKDVAHVSFIPWSGRGITKTIYSGPVEGGPLPPDPIMELLAHCVDEKTNEKAKDRKSVRLSIPKDVYDRMKRIVLDAAVNRRT